MKLSAEEKDLLTSVENGEWKSVADLAEEKKRYAEIGRKTLRKDKRVNIRMNLKVAWWSDKTVR